MKAKDIYLNPKEVFYKEHPAFDEIRNLTASNNHTLARVKAAQLIKSGHYEAIFAALMEIVDRLQDMPQSLCDFQYSQTKKMLEMAKSILSETEHDFLYHSL